MNILHDIVNEVISLSQNIWANIAGTSGLSGVAQRLVSLPFKVYRIDFVVTEISNLHSNRQVDNTNID